MRTVPPAAGLDNDREDASAGSATCTNRQRRLVQEGGIRCSSPVAAIYTESTKAAFTAFVDLAVNLVGIAISFTTGTPVTLLLRDIAGTVGTKLILLREDYSAEEFIRDVGRAGSSSSSQTSRPS